MKLLALFVVVAAVVASAIIVVGQTDTSSSSPSPKVVLQEYADALAERQYDVACRYHLLVAQRAKNALKLCEDDVSRLDRASEPLRVTLGKEKIVGDEATVRFTSNIGISSGTAVLVKFKDQWKIAIFLPDR